MITERDGEIAMRRLVGFLMAVCMVIGLLFVQQTSVKADGIKLSGSLTEDTVIQGDAEISGSLDLAGYSLTIKGNVSVYGDVKLSGGKFTVEGDVKHSAKNIIIGNGLMDISGNYIQAKLSDEGEYSFKIGETEYKAAASDASLVMEDVRGRVNVSGAVVLANSNSSVGSADGSNRLSAGILSVSGDFITVDTGTDSNFLPKANHIVEFSGNEAQNISIAGDFGGFNGIIITNSNFTLGDTVRYERLIDVNSGTASIDDINKGHIIIGFNSKESTCSEEGNIVYYMCVDCGKFFSDENATQEITREEAAVEKKEHTWGDPVIVEEATTKTAGAKKYTCEVCGDTKLEAIAKLEMPKIYYSTHVQSFGWQDEVCDGELSGTVGQSKRLEGITIRLENSPYEGEISYRTHIQGIGWQNWKSDGDMSGTSGENRRLEAIQIKLTGAMAEHYDVYYRVQAQSYGWLDWAKNGEYAGTAGYAKRLEAIQVVLLDKGDALDKAKLNGKAEITSATKVTAGKTYICKDSGVQYRTHVQSIGWQDYVMNGVMSGTSGQSKRLEAIDMKLTEKPYEGGIRYKTHIQGIGWQDWREDGEMSGTSGQAKRLEAISIELTGDMADYYDVYYRVHAQSYGWLNWSKNGGYAGTSGLSKRLEGIQVVVVKKGQQPPGISYQGISSVQTKAYIQN